MIQQALVDVADLFDVERPETQLASFGSAAARQPDPKHLKGFQQVQHRAVAHRQRRGLGVLPTCAELAAFEERETVGIEQAAAIRREFQPVVFGPSVNRPEGGEQPGPGVVAEAENFFAELIRRDPQFS